MKCGNDSEMSQLDSQLFYKDTHGHLDDNDTQNDSNNALKERTTLLSLSTPVHMIAPNIPRRLSDGTVSAQPSVLGP